MQQYYLIITPLDSKGEVDGGSLASGSYATIEDVQQELKEIVQQFHPWRHEFRIARVEKEIVQRFEAVDPPTFEEIYENWQDEMLEKGKEKVSP